MSPAERELLAAVLEALTVPYGVGRYERRIDDRASWVRTTLKGVLEEGDPEWHAAYLRSRIRDEETAAKGGQS